MNQSKGCYWLQVLKGRRRSLVRPVALKRLFRVKITTCMNKLLLYKPEKVHPCIRSNLLL